MFLVYALTGGGRIVGSDEVTMLELSRAMLRGGIAVPEGATLAGPRRPRLYEERGRPGGASRCRWSRPAERAAAVVHDAARARRWRRASAARSSTRSSPRCCSGCSTRTARASAVLRRRSLAATVLLGFTTPLWVYAKSFMAEPLQALGLLLALAGAAGARAGARDGPRRLGVLIAVSAKLSMLPLAAAVSLVSIGRAPEPGRRGVLATPFMAPVLGFAAALAGHAVYNVARFGNPFESGYGAQATASAYTTPLLVGVYGLLLSSGKGVMWFAPALWIAAPTWLRNAIPVRFAPARSAGRDSKLRIWLESLDTEARVRWGALLAAAAALLLYGRFQHWAGDGSFGPRYLLPVLPCAFLVVGARARARQPHGRRWAAVLGVLACWSRSAESASTSAPRCARPATTPTPCRSSTRAS